MRPRMLAWSEWFMQVHKPLCERCQRNEADGKEHKQHIATVGATYDEYARQWHKMKEGS